MWGLCHVTIYLRDVPLSSLRAWCNVIGLKIGNVLSSINFIPSLCCINLSHFLKEYFYNFCWDKGFYGNLLWKCHFTSFPWDTVVGDYINTMKKTTFNFVWLLNSLDTHKHRSQDNLSIKKTSLWFRVKFEKKLVNNENLNIKVVFIVLI